MKILSHYIVKATNEQVLEHCNHSTIYLPGVVFADINQSTVIGKPGNLSDLAINCNYHASDYKQQHNNKQDNNLQRLTYGTIICNFLLY